MKVKDTKMMKLSTSHHLNLKVLIILILGKYVYEGQWKNNERNGRGKQLWKDGSIY